MKKQITMESETVSEYLVDIAKCETLSHLREVLNSYDAIAHDAVLAAPKNDDEFIEFTAGLKKESRRKSAGEEFAKRYGAILMPEIMIKVAIVAFTYNIPWGMAFLRLKDEGRIVRSTDNVYRLKD